MPIYTRKGDSGRTHLFNQKETDKDSLRVAVIGNLDELNASLGVTRAHLDLAEWPRLKQIDDLLHSLQKVLFEVGTEVAGNQKYSLSTNYVKSLEDVIDHYQEKLPALGQFILPAGSKPTSFLHLSRTICRRAERLLVGLAKQEHLNPELLKFLNRLSDLLFMLARFVSKETGEKEEQWKIS